MFVVLSLERSAVGERESGVVGGVARCGLGDRVAEGSRRLWKEEGSQELLSSWKGSVQQHSRWMGWVMYQSPFGLFLCDSFAVGLLLFVGEVPVARCCVLMSLQGKSVRRQLWWGLKGLLLMWILFMCL